MFGCVREIVRVAHYGASVLMKGIMAGSHLRDPAQFMSERHQVAINTREDIHSSGAGSQRVETTRKAPCLTRGTRPLDYE